MRHYEGTLGVFDYDENEFELCDAGNDPQGIANGVGVFLRYIGNKNGTDIKIVI